MPICHKNKLVFVHIPKAGGTTIEKALGLFGDNKILDKKKLFGHGSQHLSYEGILKRSELDVSEYFSFSFTRNPWSKMVSEFFWRKRLRLERGEGFTFKNFLEMVCDFDLKDESLDPHYKEQHSFVFDAKGDQLVNFIGSMENLQRDFDFVCQEVGMDSVVLPYENKGRHKDYVHYYDDECRELVRKKYAKDIEYFGYKFGE